jgi:hypothetical protein
MNTSIETLINHAVNPSRIAANGVANVKMAIEKDTALYYLRFLLQWRHRSELHWEYAYRAMYYVQSWRSAPRRSLYWDDIAERMHYYYEKVKRGAL